MMCEPTINSLLFKKQQTEPQERSGTNYPPGSDEGAKGRDPPAVPAGEGTGAKRSRQCRRHNTEPDVPATTCASRASERSERARLRASVASEHVCERA